MYSGILIKDPVICDHCLEGHCSFTLCPQDNDLCSKSAAGEFHLAWYEPNTCLSDT